MGYSTDFIGHIDIAPTLNDAEIEYLTAFTTSRRCVRPGGPYDVPGNPLAESSADFPTEVANQVAAGQPDFWCDWSVCWEGCCLAWSGKGEVLLDGGVAAVPDRPLPASWRQGIQ